MIFTARRACAPRPHNREARMPPHSFLAQLADCAVRASSIQASAESPKTRIGNVPLPIPPLPLESPASGHG